MLKISPEKVCYIIVKAREFDGKVEIDDPEPASNPSDDKNIDVLEDLPDDPTLDELIGAIQILNDDETLDLVALNWIGRGDYTAKELAEARQQAREIPMLDRARYLVAIIWRKACRRLVIPARSTKWEGSSTCVLQELLRPASGR
jgi:hypothetical protein